MDGRLLGDVEDDRDGSQRLGQSPRAGRLLPDAPEADGNGLVPMTGPLAADPELHDDEIGAVDGPAAVVGRDQDSRPALGLEDPAGQAGHDLEPLGIGIQQHELVDDQPVLVTAEALDQLGRVGAAPTHDGDLRPHVPERNIAAHERVAAHTMSATQRRGAAPRRRRWRLENRRVGRGRRGLLLGSGAGRGLQPPVRRDGRGHGRLDATVRAALDDAGLTERPVRSTSASTAWPAWTSTSTSERSARPSVLAVGAGTDVVRNDTMAVLRAGAESGWGVARRLRQRAELRRVSARTAASSGSRAWPSCRATSLRAARGSGSGRSVSPCGRT